MSQPPVGQLIAGFKKLGATAYDLSIALDGFMGGGQDTLRWPVMWCKDHEQLETAPGCLMNQARRGL